MTADNWVIVAPGGAGPVETPARLDVFRGSARTVSKVPGPPGRGVTSYPWAVNGEYASAVTGLPEQAWDSKPADGVAYAFRPGGAYVRLGRAIAVYPAGQPGRFWIRSAVFGGHIHAARPANCTLTEMSAAGRRIAGPVAAPCTRWLIAGVPGGFVSVPTATANAARMPATFQLSRETPVQLWDPMGGSVVRTYRIDPVWIYGASDRFLAWQSRSGAGQAVSSVEITNLSTGTTRRIALPLSAGDVTWRNPVVAPKGAYLAWMEISKATFRKFSMEVPSGGGGAPAVPGPGRVKILDVATGRVVLNRATTIASCCAFDLSPDNRYLFVAASYTNLNVVPTWSATAPIRNVRLPSISDTPDSQQVIVTQHTAYQ